MGAFITKGQTKIFPDRFLAASLNIPVMLYIRTSHSKGNVSSFKTQDLMALQKLTQKQKIVGFKICKGQIGGAALFGEPPNETLSS
jgi:hypothetical protein